MGLLGAAERDLPSRSTGPGDRAGLASRLTRQRLWRAWELKEQFRDLYRTVHATQARAYLKAWCTAALRSRLRPFRNLVRRIRNHFEGAGSALGDMLRRDAEIVRDALARVLAARRPDLPHDIKTSEYGACRTFLSNFERIYTLNYDMLLYWAVMQDLEPEISTDDGFRNPDDEDAIFVAWEPYNEFQTQRLVYLHGSLHLYDSGREISKITWSRAEIPLVDQIRDALSERRYPLIVTEGSSAPNRLSPRNDRQGRTHARMSTGAMIGGFIPSGNG